MELKYENIPKWKCKIREFLAKKHNAEFTCPLAAGIFISLAAQASEEREEDKIQFWRTLKKRWGIKSKICLN